jgi:hypothetical protein
MLNMVALGNRFKTDEVVAGGAWGFAALSVFADQGEMGRLAITPSKPTDGLAVQAPSVSLWKSATIPAREYPQS